MTQRIRRLPVALAAMLVLAGTSATAASAADLAISKADSPDPVALGTALTYTIGVQNFGPEAATGVTLTDRLPRDVDFVSATAGSGPCARKGRKVTCNLGTVGSPGIVYGLPTVTIVVIPRKVGTIENTATVDGKEKDPVAANNKATATTTVIGPPPTCRGVPATIPATEGDDILVGTPGRDVIAGLGGDDTIAALGGRDLVCAGSGDDHVGAGGAADHVFGGTGRDRLLGRGGPDLLRGSSGGDLIKGGRGADRLSGGRGFDRCSGGAGFDSVRSCER